MTASVTAAATTPATTAAADSGGEVATFDAVVVGAGFAGMYMLHRLRGAGFRARVIEAGSDVGGTWYWNRYPGARCDVQSLDYQYSFDDDLQREWTWTERYATQPEILKYASHVADRFDLRRDIQFGTRVTGATWDEAASRWQITTDGGDRYTAQFLISGVGCLSASRIPDFEGLERFTGPTYHTGQWPHEGVDFSGKRVAVIGTGSSGIQSIPVIASQAEQLYVFQRTPNYSLPANNQPLSEEQVTHYKTNFQEIKAEARKSFGGVPVVPPTMSALEVSEEERRKVFEERWHQGGFQMIQAYKDITVSNEANATAAEFVREKIREVVKDPEVAEKLAPKTYPLGTKRICIDSGYFETYNRDNVALIDINEAPIEGMTEKGVKAGGEEFEVDAIVFATGFDAMTGALLAMDIKGRAGATLRKKWEAGPRTYLGVAVAGFPNMFMITGPGSPSVLSNMIMSIEQHVDWITGCMEYLREHDAAAIEALVPDEDAWVEHVNQLAGTTLYPQANSWYLGANVPGKPRVFMPYVGGLHTYRAKCDEVAAKGYAGFTVG